MVQEVVDGDTITLADGRRVRYLGIDTPEMGWDQQPPEFLAPEAKKFNAQLVQNQKLHLEYDVERYDQYNRLLAYLFLPDERMVNAELVRQGLARVYLFPPNLRYKDLLVACQRQAMEAGQGIWQRPLKADEPYYLGNSNSFRFHRPDCQGAKKMSPENRIIFAHPQEAYAQGYSPCKMCRP
ncbi:MAG: thermonuclease family protein [Desulfobacteraceae bacterium]